MAIENAVIYVLTELPALAIAKVLQRCFAWTPRWADTVPTLVLMAVGFGLVCWLGGCMSGSRTIEVVNKEFCNGGQIRDARIGQKPSLPHAIWRRLAQLITPQQNPPVACRQRTL
ncbi:MAG: hypothetical protein EOO38_06930 [Cytophagaceae bacterium]|nr:MAG: hypothetical protein EOO38_06930 [Cytophagaceae bacterium]